MKTEGASTGLVRRPHTNRPMELPCDCEERSDEAIQLDRPGALCGHDIKVKD